MLDALFPRRFHIGKIGDGGRAKLAVNLILGLNRMALAEGLTFAERMGLDPKAFLEVAKGAASYSQVMETKGEKMLARDFAPEGRVKQTLKDVHMMLDQGEKLGQELPMLKVHCDVLEACVRAGEAERDNSIIVEEIRGGEAAEPGLDPAARAAFDRAGIRLSSSERVCHADVVLRSRRVLDGFAYRAGGERREIRAQAHGPRQGRAAHRRNI